MALILVCAGFPGSLAASAQTEVLTSAARRQASGPRLRIPVAGVKPTDLVDTYSEARSEGRVHNALDIPAPRGTPVVAATGGTILKRFLSERGGTTLYLLASDRRTILYHAHLERYADGITEGKPVRAGDVIAYVGDSGNVAPNNTHLHFEVTLSSDPKRFWVGLPQNPYPLLRYGRPVSYTPLRTGKPGNPVQAARRKTVRPAKMAKPAVKPLPGKKPEKPVTKLGAWKKSPVKRVRKSSRSVTLPRASPAAHRPSSPRSGRRQPPSPAAS